MDATSKAGGGGGVWARMAAAVREAASMVRSMVIGRTGRQLQY
jgi:hypothetical protein